MNNPVDIGHKCVYCLEDTSFGSGKFVNRIPADTSEYIGYCCADCASYECDRCGKWIEVDEDLTPYNVYTEDDPRQHQDFEDGAYRVHEECLTKNEEEVRENLNE